MWFQQYDGPHFSFPMPSQKVEYSLQSTNKMTKLDNSSLQNETLGAFHNITQITENTTSVQETTQTSNFGESTIWTSMIDTQTTKETTSTEFQTLEEKSTLANSRIICKTEENLNTPQIASYQALYILCGVMMGVFVLSCIVLLVIYIKRKRNTFRTRHRQYTLSTLKDSEDTLKY